MRKSVKSAAILLVILTFVLSFSIFAAAEEDVVCSVYFTGIGCPHCAKSDPVIFEKLIDKYKNFVVIEYEIYQTQGNGPLLYDYKESYNTPLGVPLIILDKSNFLSGDTSIIWNLEDEIINRSNSACALPNQEKDFSEVKIQDLPGKPKIWGYKRVMFQYTNEPTNYDVLRELVTTDNIEETLKKTSYEITKPLSLPLSGRYVEFEKAALVGGWMFEWNGADVSQNNSQANNTGNNTQDNPEINEDQNGQSLNIVKILSLAAVDAINPCALAVLALILIAIITHNPKNKKTVLLSGLAFTLSVFVIYLFYGLVLIKFFQLIQFLTSVRVILYKVLGVVAIILGILNIRDFFRYKPGRMGTEMPISWRPSMKKLVSKATSPKGAMVVGAFVTLFLLPCTIGPYVIASGILSVLNILKTLPWLLLYNLVFVLPMIIVTVLVYAGVAKVEDVSGWKDRNIKKLHLAAGIIMFLIGIAMIIGWV